MEGGAVSRGWKVVATVAVALLVVVVVGRQACAGSGTRLLAMHGSH